MRLLLVQIVTFCYDCIAVQYVHSQVIMQGHCVRGSAEAIPELSLPSSWFTGRYIKIDQLEDINLSCSLESSTVFASKLNPIFSEDSPGVLLRELYWRRIQECYEQTSWFKSFHFNRSLHQQYQRTKLQDTTFPFERSKSWHRRKVKSLVIWVGSKSEASRNLVEHQSQTLLGQPFEEERL